MSNSPTTEAARQLDADIGELQEKNAALRARVVHLKADLDAEQETYPADNVAEDSESDDVTTAVQFRDRMDGLVVREPLPPLTALRAEDAVEPLTATEEVPHSPPLPSAETNENLKDPKWWEIGDTPLPSRSHSGDEAAMAEAAAAVAAAEEEAAKAAAARAAAEASAAAERERLAAAALDAENEAARAAAAEAARAAAAKAAAEAAKMDRLAAEVAAEAERLAAVAAVEELVTEQERLTAVAAAEELAIEKERLAAVAEAERLAAEAEEAAERERLAAAEAQAEQWHEAAEEDSGRFDSSGSRPRLSPPPSARPSPNKAGEQRVLAMREHRESIPSCPTFVEGLADPGSVDRKLAQHVDLAMRSAGARARLVQQRQIAGGPAHLAIASGVGEDGAAADRTKYLCFPSRHGELVATPTAAEGWAGPAQRPPLQSRDFYDGGRPVDWGSMLREQDQLMAAAAAAGSWKRSAARH